MMIEQRVVIFGSGGMAKELIGYMEGGLLNYEIVCVVSTEPFNNPAFAFEVYEKVPQGLKDVGYLLAVSDPSLKRKIVSENEDKWISFVHDSAKVPSYATIGKGCILAPQTIITGDGILGDFVFMNTNATVGHDCVVGDYTTLCPYVEMLGGAKAGTDCFMGCASYLLPKVCIPSHTKVSAGAIVRKSIDAPETLYGDPAKPRLKVA